MSFLVGLAMLVACSKHAETPRSALRPFDGSQGPQAQGPQTQELSQIDTLMWHQPDSALAVMLEFAGSEAADSLDVFEGHYCQVLVAELLYKNFYKQSNRKELLKAVAYFDSLNFTPNDTPTPKSLIAGADPLSPTRNDNIVFLAARAHYMNGVGFYERDSVVAACGEYLKALEVVETHFPNLETQDVASLQVEHLPRFMGLTYGRLAELFSGQFMQEPAIVCCKRALEFQEIEPGSPLNQSGLLYLLGKQYDKLNQYDSAAYYYDEALRLLPDTNNLVYRDLVSQYAILKYETENDAESFIQDLGCMVAQAADESEKLTRYLTIGAFYADVGQNDSALKYLTPVFMYKDDYQMTREAARCMRDIYQSQGDSLKVIQYAMYLTDNEVHEGESNAQVSQLNELFQRHLQWKQKKAESERKLAEQLAARRRLVRGVVTAVVVLLVVGLGLWWWLAKRKKEHEAETQTWHMEKQQLQTQVDDALQQLQTQADDALQQARAMLPQRVNEIYSSKVENRLERIMDEFEAAYPKALERLAAVHPELNEVERQMAVLNFLHFRAKEEANLTGYTEGTTLKYRSNLNKKAGSDPISALLAEGKI
ncbi:MAG: tetratricopeptide repeat protein [Bacteroidales bacterium]|nr:tetratricopeptide repeat protein [Bacteroidales bacterium]